MAQRVGLFTAVLISMVWCIFATAQTSQPANVVEFRVVLSYANDYNQSTVSEVLQPGLENRANAGVGIKGEDATTYLRMRVQVLNRDGSTVGERSPGTDGVTRFQVPGSIGTGAQRQYFYYRVHVYGPDIQEVWLDNVEPGRLDPTLSVQLHPKTDKRSQKPGEAISAGDLKIPSGARKEFEKGNKALLEGKNLEAVEHLEKAVEIYPAYERAWNALGVAKVKQGDVAGGKQAFQRALKENDKSVSSNMYLARLAMKDADYPTADKHLQATLAVQPFNAEALSMDCQAEILEGKNTEVAQSATKLHSIPHEGLGLCHFAAGLAYTNLNKPAEAVKEYELFVKETPGDSALVQKAQANIAELNKQPQDQK